MLKQAGNGKEKWSGLINRYGKLVMMHRMWDFTRKSTFNKNYKDKPAMFFIKEQINKPHPLFYSLDATQTCQELV